jgi:hypothetical protein
MLKMSTIHNKQTQVNTIKTEYIESQFELSDAELEVVAGGQSKSSSGCRNGRGGISTNCGGKRG